MKPHTPVFLIFFILSALIGITGYFMYLKLERELSNPVRQIEVIPPIIIPNEEVDYGKG